jgi:hypothetical protein
MNPSRARRSGFLFAFVLLAGGLAGCAGVYAGGEDYGGGYYDTGLVDYGGWGDWGGDYRVGPYRDGDGRFGRDGGGRFVPGIPMGGRDRDGGHFGGGGGHGEGGGHR